MRFLFFLLSFLIMVVLVAVIGIMFRIAFMLVFGAEDVVDIVHAIQNPMFSFVHAFLLNPPWGDIGQNNMHILFVKSGFRLLYEIYFCRTMYAIHSNGSVQHLLYSRKMEVPR